MPLPPDILATLPAPRHAEAETLHAIFSGATGWAPRLWQTGRLIGYGRYRYRTKAGTEGEFLATGFNIRARDIALHILPGYRDYPEIAARLGPHKRGKSCWYLRSLDQVDQGAITELIRAGLADLARHETILPT